jgi:hypothetical protein
MSASDQSHDVEKDGGVSDYAHLTNDVVQSFSWNNVNITLKHRKSSQPVEILSGVSGYIEAGEVLALMGPRKVLLSL